MRPVSMCSEHVLVDGSAGSGRGWQRPVHGSSAASSTHLAGLQVGGIVNSCDHIYVVVPQALHQRAACGSGHGC